MLFRSNRLRGLLTASLMLFLGNVGYRQDLSFLGSSALLIGEYEIFIRLVLWILKVFGCKFLNMRKLWLYVFLLDYSEC